MVTAHQVTCRVFRSCQLGITFIEDFAGSRRIQDFFNSKASFQFQMSPVIQRIAECIRDCFGPFFEFFPIGSVLTRTITFVYPVATHCTPFVMVTAQPDFCNRLELIVVGHHFRNQVTMIVDNRHLGCMIVIQFLRSFRFKQEVFIHKFFHKALFLSLCILFGIFIKIE